MENGKEPINPHLVHTHSGEVQEYSKGLTKREYFAGLAMQGILAAQTITGFMESKEVAKRAVRQADELLKQLNEQ